jgi:hypothetical protein
MRFTQQSTFFGGPSLMRQSRARPRTTHRGKINDAAGGRLRCDQILRCHGERHRVGKVGAVVAALALTYGVAMSIALVV